MNTATALTREQVQAMPAGRELDGLIAEHVIGLTRSSYGREVVFEHPDYHTLTIQQRVSYHPAARLYSLALENRPDTFTPLLAYSTDIAAAWQAAEALREGDTFSWPFVLTEDRYGGAYSGGQWLASFGVGLDVYDEGPHGEDIDAMEFWQVGESYSSRGAALADVAACATPAHAICLAALLHLLTTANAKSSAAPLS